MMKREYFNQLAERWDDLPAPGDAPAKVEDFVRRAVRPRDRLVLDVGCGTGALLSALLETGDPERRVVEYDLAERMLEAGRRKQPDPRVLWLCADALNPPFKPASFDAVLCFGVLPHFTDMEAGLSRLLCCLREGGALSVGHLMGSEALNAFHSHLEGPVRHDRLPGAAHLSDCLERLGAAPVCVEENWGWYFVRVVKQSL